MVPTMILVGLVVGRLWAIPVGGAVWGAVVLAGSPTGVGSFVLAVALGAANVAAGVLVHRAVARLTRQPLRP
jgi:hypothetical protein